MSKRGNFNRKKQNFKKNENFAFNANTTTATDNTVPKAMDNRFNTDINKSLQAYDREFKDFQDTFRRWKFERNSALSQLRELASEVHTDQLTFNNNSLVFKEINVGSRQLKTNDGSKLDFFASLASLVTDAIDGINSVAQACNIDTHMKKFGEIMEEDKKYTELIHRARSRCFEQYRGVEEVIRRYHSDTFGSTVNKISKTINAEHMWLQLKNSSDRSEISQVIQKVDVFFQQVSRVAVFTEISKSVEDYVDSNPAVLEACASTGKAIYGIYDTWGRDAKNSGAVANIVSFRANRELISRNEMEISKLSRLVSDESNPQAKLESKIKEAIQDFAKELREMEQLYNSCRARCTPVRNQARYIYDSDSD